MDNKTKKMNPTEKIKSEIEDFKKSELRWISKEGYVCYVVLMDMGHRCGYVRVDKKNITNEINSYDNIPVSVHGGLTYGSNGLWGFDCAHYGDTLQKWTLENVKKEVESLSEQLSKITWEDIINKKLEYMPDWFKIRAGFKQAQLSQRHDDIESFIEFLEKLQYNQLFPAGYGLNRKLDMMIQQKLAELKSEVGK